MNNSDAYIEQPELANQKGMVFHHNNERPHTRQKLLKLGRDVLSHPP